MPGQTTAASERRGGVFLRGWERHSAAVAAAACGSPEQDRTYVTSHLFFLIEKRVVSRTMYAPQMASSPGEPARLKA